MQNCKYVYLKHIVNKFLDGAFPVIVLLVAVEVQVEPMSKFDLEANSDDVFSFLLRHIYDKTAETSPDGFAITCLWIVCRRDR